MIERFDIDEDIFLIYAEIPKHWDTQYEDCLSWEELQYCRQSKDLETQCVRAALRMLTKKYLPLPNEVYQNSSGKPWVGPDVQISFSHKKNSILFGARFGEESIGVDLESLTEPVQWSVFSENFFSSEEMASFLSLAATSMHSEESWTMDQIYRLIFSVKEAYSKKMDRAFEPKKIEVFLVEQDKGRVKTIVRPSKHQENQLNSSLPEIHFLTFRHENFLVTNSL